MARARLNINKKLKVESEHNFDGLQVTFTILNTVEPLPRNVFVSLASFEKTGYVNSLQI